MPPGWSKFKMTYLLVVFNVVAYVFLTLTRPTVQSPASRTLIPKGPFWAKEISKSFWNREQQRLDYINNPNYNQLELPDEFKGVEPKSDPCEPDKRVQEQMKDFNQLPKLFQEYLLHAHCKSFPMLINQPNICKDKPFLLMVLKSLIPQFERRQAIRETWGKVGEIGDKKVVTVFLIGNPNTVEHDYNPDLSALLKREAEIFNDILMWDFRDTFLNLTLKDTLYLDWLKEYCPEAQFILKGDDDVFVNTHLIIKYLEDLPPADVPNLFVGDIVLNAKPFRNMAIKYFVPESYFVGIYPPYACGGGFLYSAAVALKMQAATRKVVFFPIDDVYNGMCLEKEGIVPVKHDAFRTFDITDNEKKNPCVYRSIMVVHKRSPQELKRLWKWVSLPELECQ